ncbi:MAG: PVC-type heme-binding CxxCH protein [Opitutaceae bacterium]
MSRSHHPAPTRLSPIIIFAAGSLVLAGCSRSASSNISTASATPAPGAASAASISNPDSGRQGSAQFKFATQTLSVPEGFTVEQVAGPPLVNRPISIAFDPQGRLYATDSSGLSERADKQFAEKPHRIVRLEDRDGDGRFDHSIVFAEKMMFPQGALFYEGSLYVAAPPHLWKLTDTNDDGVADERVAWHDGKTLTGCANDLHGPYLGPDGWIYWTKGAFAEQRHTLGNGKTFVTRAAHIFRSRPDATGLEPVLTGGMDNPVGVTFTATGERILSGTFFQVGVAGKRDGLIHAVYGGVYGKENAATTGHARTGDLMPIMTHMGAAAPCGSITYRSQGFGPGFADNLFVCYFNLRKISRHQLVPDGATFRTIDRDFITSDSQDFRPTDVLEDADGSLLVVETGGWYKICCPTSQLAKPDVLGGIYRIRKSGASKPADPRGLNVPWGTSGAADLAKLLAAPRPYVQDRAIHLLGGKGSSAVPVLNEVITKSPDVLARRNAVWALARIDGPLARAAVRAALSDRDASVVHTALQGVSLHRDADSLDRLVAILAGDDRMLARLAAEALGRIGDARAIAPLLAATTRNGESTVTPAGAPENPAERIFEHALVYALIETGRSAELLARLKTSGHPRVVRAALVALDQMGNGSLKPEHVVDWLDSNVPMLRQTAGWIVGFHADWGDALATFFQRRFAEPQTGSARAGLQTQLAQLAKSATIQDLLAKTAADTTAERDVRLLSLGAMSAAGLKEFPAAWLSALAAVLSANDPALTSQAVATARALPWPRAGHAELATALARTGRDAALPAAVRLEALASATPAAIGAIDAELFHFVTRHLDTAQPMLVRGSAAAVLAKARLTSEQQFALAGMFTNIGALELPKLLPAFEQTPNETLGLNLVAALKTSPGLPGIRANTLKPLLAKYPRVVQQQGDELLTMLNSDINRQNARVDELLASTKDGEVRRGQVVFHSEKAACAMCHVLGHRGGRLGPDLTHIGKIRNERELLEAVLFPSATFVRGFEPFVVSTKNGEAHSGIMRKDGADEVVLATGPESEQRIARADIKEIQPGPVSPMPPGMEAILSTQEIADLMVFLKSRQ